MSITRSKTNGLYPSGGALLRGRGVPLLQPVMRNGERVGTAVSIEQIREHTARELECLPAALQSLAEAPPYPVHVDDELRRLADAVDRRKLE